MAPIILRNIHVLFFIIAINIDVFSNKNKQKSFNNNTKISNSSRLHFFEIGNHRVHKLSRKWSQQHAIIKMKSWIIPRRCYNFLVGVIKKWPILMKPIWICKSKRFGTCRSWNECTTSINITTRGIHLPFFRAHFLSVSLKYEEWMKNEAMNSWHKND